MKKIVCLILSIILVLQTILVFASGKGDNNKDTPKLESFGKYIVFPVSSKAAGIYSCLHWKTQGFILTVTDKDGKVVSVDDSIKLPNKPKDVSSEHPFLKYSSAATGNRNFAVAIYKSAEGIVKGITGADGDITESIEDIYGAEAFEKIKQTGGKIKLDPRFTVLEGNTKTVTKDGVYDQNDFKDLGLYYTVEQIHDGKWLGVSFPGTTIEDMKGREIEVEFGPDNTIDFSTTILRTGTEDGFYVDDEEHEYEAVVEMSAANYDDKQIPNIRISITGGYLSEEDGSVISGGSTLNKKTLSSWLKDTENLKGTKKLPNLISKINAIGWLQNPINTVCGDKEYRMSARNIRIRNTGEKNIYFNEEENTSKRYYIFKWKASHNATQVKIIASINYDGPIEAELDRQNNRDIAIIYVNPSPKITDKCLDYDVYSKEFELEINKSNILEAQIDEPASKGYLFNSTWAGSTTGELNRDITDPYELIHGNNLIDINSQYGAINDSSNYITRMPIVGWITDRLSFGYTQSTGIYSNKGDLEYSGDKGDNGKAPKIGFTINTYGNISRQASTNYNTGYYYHSHSDSCYTETTDAEGVKSKSLTCGESSGDHYYGYTTDTVTQNAEFLPKPVKDDVSIQALIYNGTSMPLKNHQEDEGVTPSNGGWDNKLVWEGDRYPINVKRYMRKLNVNGYTTELVETPGFYGKTRTFQHLDQAEVTLSKVYSLEDNFAADRQKAQNNARNYKNRKFEKAPFATDLELLKRFDYPIKSGYFYVPYSVYEAKVKTVKYINGDYTGKTSEHEKIVENVKNAFDVQLGIPTINSSKTNITELPVSKIEKYDFKSNKLKYDDGPSDSINEYLNGSEKTLLGKTDELFKSILEGWSFSGTEDSWGDIGDPDAHKYREYVKGANIHKVIEETTITFTVNPSEVRYYINIQAKDRDYKINVSLGSFTNGRSKPLTAKGPDSWDAITFSVRGSRLDDLNN